MEQHDTIYPENKVEFYDLLAAQLGALTASETSPVANLANAASLLYYALKDINWAGFYLMDRGSLLLGPFQGRTACIRIPLGRGVCGTAAATGKIQLVPDVHQFPGHIACDSASNSEIVLPIRANGEIVGVLDIDSPLLNRFNEEDAAGLSKLVAILEANCSF
ncbi:MAG: GAF domain-containing protein [Lachnospiraceae bacterium]|nr:GAF domain-containing protein [Lachnospiraceae bacterium]